MKSGGLTAAMVVLAGLGGLVWWTNKHPKVPDTSVQAPPKILALGADQIEGIRIARPGFDPVVLKKTGKEWTITEPKPLPADQDAVKPMVTSLASLTSDRLIEEHPASLTEFGLATPPGEVDVTIKGGTVHRVLFGSDSPTGNSTYVKLASNPSVYTLSTLTKTGFDKTLNDLRDKRLLTFDEDKLADIAVTTKRDTIELTKDPTAGWQISKPKVLRADPLKAQDLIRRLKEAKMDLTDETPKPGNKVVTIYAAGQTLVITEAADKTYYANGHKLAGDLGDLKDKTVEDFRNKKLFDFGFNDPSKVEIDGVSYDKSPKKQAIIDKLRDFSATGFANSLKGTLAMTIVATSGKQEKVIINHEGDEYYAQRENEPAIYLIEPKTVEDLRKSLK